MKSDQKAPVQTSVGNEAVLHTPLPGLLRVRCELEALASLELPPWTGSLLHGALGQAVRTMECTAACGAAHAPSPDASRCLYARLFEAPPPADSKSRAASVRPAPFVLEVEAPGARGRTVRAGERFSFSLVLIGPAGKEVGAVGEALGRMGAAGLGRTHARLRLAELAHAPVEPVTQQGSEFVGEAAMLSIRARTPLRLYRSGALLGSPSFADVVEAAGRRVASLSAYYGDGSDLPDLRPLLATASRVTATRQDWRYFEEGRYSSRQEQAQVLHGTLGQATFEGEVGPFVPLLQRAAQVGLGKATTFGFGAFGVALER